MAEYACSSPDNSGDEHFDSTGTVEDRVLAALALGEQTARNQTSSRAAQPDAADGWQFDEELCDLESDGRDGGEAACAPVEMPAATPQPPAAP
eukprot:1870554-Pleurochrysis_carterae.AAC.1